MVTVVEEHSSSSSSKLDQVSTGAMLSLNLSGSEHGESAVRLLSFIMHCRPLCVIHPSLIIRCTTGFTRAAPTSGLLPRNSIILLSASQGHPTDENCTFHCLWREHVEEEMTEHRGSHHSLNFFLPSDFSVLLSFWRWNTVNLFYFLFNFFTSLFSCMFAPKL